MQQVKTVNCPANIDSAFWPCLFLRNVSGCVCAALEQLLPGMTTTRGGLLKERLLAEVFKTTENPSQRFSSWPLHLPVDASQMRIMRVARTGLCGVLYDRFRAAQIRQEWPAARRYWGRGRGGS